MKTKNVLWIISKLGKISIYTLEILSLGQGRTYKNLRRKVFSPFYLDWIQEKSQISKYRISPEEKKRRRQNFYNLLTYLQRQGLAEKHKSKGSRSSYWTITNRGKKRIENLKKRAENSLPIETYKIKKDKGLNIVIFDIPEKERGKRNWLRFNLLAMGFQKLQKSVWIGNIKLPVKFLNNIENLNLFPYIEIFSIYKTGTIKKDVIKKIFRY